MRRDLFAAHAALELEHWWFRGRRDIVQAVVAVALARQERPVIVDIGCGTGANLASFSDHYERVGIDTSPDAIALARARFPRIRFLEGHAPADLGNTVARADLILLMDVLEHVHDDVRLLREILAAIKPGCRVLITVPAHIALWTEHDVSYGHYRRYSLEGFRMLWKGLPVTEELCGFFNARLYPLIRVVRTIARMTGRASGAGGTDLAMPPRILNSMLHLVFSGERHRLAAAYGDAKAPAYRTGVSLIAVLRREQSSYYVGLRPASAADAQAE